MFDSLDAVHLGNVPTTAFLYNIRQVLFLSEFSQHLYSRCALDHNQCPAVYNFPHFHAVFQSMTHFILLSVPGMALSCPTASTDSFAGSAPLL